jgi:hypothetical protein
MNMMIGTLWNFTLATRIATLGALPARAMRNVATLDAHLRGGRTATSHVLQQRKEKAVDLATTHDVMTATSTSGTAGMKTTKMITVGHVVTSEGVLTPTPCVPRSLHCLRNAVAPGVPAHPWSPLQPLWGATPPRLQAMDACRQAQNRG